MNSTQSDKEDTDENIAAYIDYFIQAIITNKDRHDKYHYNPTMESYLELMEHSGYITQAESQLDIDVQRILRNFKALIKYEDHVTPNAGGSSITSRPSR